MSLVQLLLVNGFGEEGKKAPFFCVAYSVNTPNFKLST
jgi:hypothetical protein